MGEMATVDRWEPNPRLTHYTCGAERFVKKNKEGNMERAQTEISVLTLSVGIPQ